MSSCDCRGWLQPSIEIRLNVPNGSLLKLNDCRVEARGLEPPAVVSDEKGPGRTGAFFCKGGTSAPLRGLRRFRVLVDFRLGDLAERAVGVLFFIQCRIEQLDGGVVTKLVPPSL